MNIIKKLLHTIYEMIGHILCSIYLVYWKMRDRLSPPKEKAILFVAHPDDDTLFFHTFIKEYMPYVVLCTAGWSLRRIPCFFKAMHHYGVRYRVYPLHTRDQRVAVLEKYIRESLSVGSFELCATHNATGEYGHEMHKRVHQAVRNNTNLPMMVPVAEDAITEYPLDDENVSQKEFIFKKIYVTETWVLEQYREWVENEKLETVEK